MAPIAIAAATIPAEGMSRSGEALGIGSGDAGMAPDSRAVWSGGKAGAGPNATRRPWRFAPLRRGSPGSPAPPVPFS